MKHYLLISLIAISLVIIVLIITQFLYIRYNGSVVPTPVTNREVQTSGSGQALKYVIMGDSTSVSQGSEYDEGFAAASVNHLAQRFQVTSINIGVSGARTADVLTRQLPKAVEFKPDLALIAIGANDATHFISGKTIRESMQATIDSLKQANSKVQIVVTASPAMDSVSRFPHGTKQIMGLRTKQVNKVFEQLVTENGLILAPIAQKTRAAFLADPTLTASDNFHPNARGYALWIPIINKAIDQAISQRD